MTCTPSRFGAASISEVLTMTDRILTIAQLTDLLGLSRATIYRQIAADPAFPRPVKIGRATRFRASDLQAFIASTAAPVKEAAL